MKTDIHPSYVETKVHCSCGETFTTYSTKKEIAVEICSKCHPFYTGKQKFVDSGGRVERFQKKFEAARAKIEAKAKQVRSPESPPETAGQAVVGSEKLDEKKHDDVGRALRARQQEEKEKTEENTET